MFSLLLALLPQVGPPPDRVVLERVNLPPALGESVVVKNKLANGLIAPLPGLGFLSLPVAVWECDVYHTPRAAPAGAPPVRMSARFFAWAE